MLLTLITGIGLGSIIGAGISAVIGWRVAILNLRQASINALRDDLATYLKEVEVMHHTIGTALSPENASEQLERERQIHEARVVTLFIRRRILLRLSEDEPLHAELAEKVNAFERYGSRVPDQEAVEALLNVSRKVLKRELEDAKWGPLAKPMRQWRD